MAVSLGYKEVYRYPAGYPDWLARGFPVVKPDFAGHKYTEPKSQPVPIPVPTGIYLLLVWGAVFLAGVALNLTPCIYPLIPITVSYFGGRSDAVKDNRTLHGLIYIVGLSITNSTLGVFAAMTGSLVGSLLQNSLILLFIAAILLLFATSLFELWEIRLPVVFNSMATKSYSGYGGTLFMGLSMGAIAAPCIGPFVIGLLGWIAAIGQIWFGFSVFFILSLGMGTPLFLLAVSASSIEKLPRSGQWMVWVKKLMGWILVGMAVYFVRPLMSEGHSILLFSILTVTAGVHLGWLEGSKGQSPTFERIRTIVGLGCIVAFFLIGGKYILRGPGISWQQYTAQIMVDAKQNNQPVIIDFYAAWCTPCNKLDARTFHNREVVQLAGNYLMVKIDLTTGEDELYASLLQQYQIKGVPTVLFIDAAGEERRDLRLVDYLQAEDFLRRMRKLADHQ